MTTTSKIFVSIGAALVAFTAFGAYLANTPDGQDRTAQREVIAACWEEQARKSLEPGTARLVAGACERLEADFRQKWNREP